jgi:hypothetical protein
MSPLDESVLDELLTMMVFAPIVDGQAVQKPTEKHSSKSQVATTIATATAVSDSAKVCSCGAQMRANSITP